MDARHSSWCTQHFTQYSCDGSSLFLFSKNFTTDISVCKSIINRKYGIVRQLYIVSLIYTRLLKITDVSVMEISVNTPHLCCYCVYPCEDVSTFVLGIFLRAHTSFSNWLWDHYVFEMTVRLSQMNNRTWLYFSMKHRELFIG
jgi:hypothetical protein